MIVTKQYVFAVCIFAAVPVLVYRDIWQIKKVQTVDTPFVTFDQVRALSEQRGVQKLFIGKLGDLDTQLGWEDVAHTTVEAFKKDSVATSSNVITGVATTEMTRQFVPKILDVVAVRFHDGSYKIAHLPMGITKAVHDFVNTHVHRGVEVVGDYSPRSAIGWPIRVLAVITLLIMLAGIVFG